MESAIPDDSLEVKQTSPRHYHITHEHGLCICSFSQRGGWLTISSLDVDETARKQGIAKNMLRRSEELARELGASAIIAAIISRESLEAFRSVFGDEDIEIGKISPFEDGSDPSGEGIDRRTEAVLFVELPRD